MTIRHSVITMQKKLQHFISSYIDGFPSLPSVVTRVMEITADTNSSTDDLFSVICSDQTLTANILKMANSIFYGLPKKVGSLQHALSLLGYVEVRNMVITQAMFNNFKHLDAKQGMDLNCFWSHALTCALTSKLVAGHAGCRANDLYIACLIHDIGKLVIAMALPEAYAILVKDSGLNRGYAMHEVEMRYFEITHADIAKRILSQWMLPEKLIQGVGYHHHPERAVNHADIAWGVHAADLLVHWSEQVTGGDEAVATALAQLLMRPEMVAALCRGAHRWETPLLERYQGEIAELKAGRADMFALYSC